MKVTKRYDQHRRDLSIDMVCEGCGATDSYAGAYDDHNFWVNVVPNFDCKVCGESTISLNLTVEDTHTRYPEGFQI
jgi:hypothetical protein